VRTGIVILPEYRWWVAEPKWRVAEEYGFHHAWTYDNLGWRSLVNGPWFGAIPTLTAAAMVTSTIRLGTFVASPNFRQPVPFARDIITLDDVSDGRLTIGLGAGAGADYDMAVMGHDEMTPAVRIERFEEFIFALDSLLIQEQTSYKGQHFQISHARMAPGSVQRPRLPFVIAANGSRAMSIAAHHATGWIATGPETEDLTAWWHGVAAAAERFREMLAKQGRAEHTIDYYLNADSSPTYSMSSVEHFRDVAGQASELGFTDLIVHWPRTDGLYAGSETVLERIAEDVLPELAKE
jgi:alkanesulfonate monooxygenase SsuD/methylene tetrahydromethanopterin reductase-like flavin-dependent oxidoreductase (luciferase family)